MASWQEQGPRISVVLVALAVVFALSASGCTPTPVCTNPANEIVSENCRFGNQPSEWQVQGEGDPSIQGFATDISVDQGARIDFKIKTDAARYRIDIYRLGYYEGAGARLAATICDRRRRCPRRSRPAAEEGSSGLVDCGNWAVSASWQVPATAVSGIYIARLVREAGPAAPAMSSSSCVTTTAPRTSCSRPPIRPGRPTTATAGTASTRVARARTPVAPTRSATTGRSRTRQTETEDWLFNSEYPMVRWLEAQRVRRELHHRRRQRSPRPRDAASTRCSFR